MRSHSLRAAGLVGLVGLACRSTSPTTSRPIRTPELYGAGVFSTAAWDFYIAFSPDESRALFGRADDAFERFTILETKRRAGQWTRPVKPRFASAFSDADAHISPDGRTVYFISNRPAAGGTTPAPIHEIFMATLDARGEWGPARRLPAPVNDGKTDRWGPMVTRSGDLYFGAELPGTHGGSDLWVSRRVDGVYQPPENLGAAINTSAHEVEPWIAPDGNHLVFSALRRRGGAGGYDLFASRRTTTGWTAARPLGAVNTPASEWNHSISPDGTWLYFTSGRRDGKGDIFRIRTEHAMTATPSPEHRALTIAPGGAMAMAYEVSAPARTLYISGQIPTRPDGSVPTTFDDQCRQVWANIDQVLADAGMTRRDLVKVTTYLSDHRYRADNSRIRREILGDHLPALTVVIAGIYDPAWLLEIEAVAAR